MKELKFLYETTVKKQIEEKSTVTKEENGEKVEISRILKKAKPVKVAILKPQRKLYEGAEIFYAKQIATYIQGGLLPYSLVAKRYANDGGPLSEPEKLHLEKLKAEAGKLQAELFALVGKEDEKAKQRNDILNKINALHTEVNAIQNAYADIFDNTAEMKARNKTIEWWVLHLAYIDEDGTGYKPLFGDGNHESKLEKYDDIDDKDNEFINECIRKLSYLISFWFAARVNLSNVEFENMDNLFTETMTEYTVIEDKEEVKVEEIKPETKV